MTEQVTLTLPDSLAQRVHEVATLTQRPLEEVLLEWLRRGSVEPVNSNGSLEAIAPLSHQIPASTLQGGAGCRSCREMKRLLRIYMWNLSGSTISGGRSMYRLMRSSGCKGAASGQPSVGECKTFLAGCHAPNCGESYADRSPMNLWRSRFHPKQFRPSLLVPIGETLSRFGSVLQY